ncbi:MAG: hypothetical protein M1820_002470 [Bogoriella megaspora]|nr:MAG: hypothetical protein M1820_002470 [Bogoriella megaspora]
MFLSPIASQQSSGITRGLFDVYLSYKQDTKAIISWLVNHGDPFASCSQRLSVRDLFHLAKVIRNNAVEMPDIIHFHFRQAIKARTQMTKVFRRDSVQQVDDDSNSSHEFFTASLTKIYAELCECCGKPADVCDRDSHARISKDVTANTSNRFTTLPLEVDISNGTDNIRSVPQEGRLHASPKKENIELAGHCPRLIGDSLSDAFELRKEIQEIDDLFAVATDTWTLAGQGQIPFIVAIMVSQAVYAESDVNLRRLNSNFGISNPAQLASRFATLQESMALSVVQPEDPNTIVRDLDRTWQQLLAMKNRPVSQVTENATASSRVNSSFILRGGSHSTSNDTEAIAWLLRDVARHLVTLTKTMQTNFYRIGSPVWADVGYFLTHSEDIGGGFFCSFGLELLLKSYKSYLFASEPRKQPSSCRLRALRFAQEAIPNIVAVLNNPTMPCRCPDTLAIHLEQLQEDLEQFLGTKEFDLYFQSSWVSGSHMLEISEALFYYGLRLFSYRNYVSSVLHVYNVLRLFNILSPVALLDSLCNAFSGILFPGGRPKRHFKSSYLRHKGGRLHFHSHNHDSGCHSMAVPAHTAKATAGFGLPHGDDDPRFNYKKTSLIYHIKEQGYLPDPPTWDQILRIASNSQSPPDSPTLAEKPKPCSHHRYKSPPDCPRERLTTLRNALTSSFNDPLCSARINFFAIYLEFERIVSRISDEYHGDDTKTGQRCLCFAENLIAAADRSKVNGKSERLKYYCCKELPEICERIIREEVGGKRIEQFLWTAL